MAPRESSDRGWLAGGGCLSRPEARVPSPKQSGPAARVGSAGRAQSRGADRVSAGAVRTESRGRCDAAFVRRLRGDAAPGVDARRGVERVSAARLGRVGGLEGTAVRARQAARRCRGDGVPAAGRVSPSGYDAHRHGDDSSGATTSRRASCDTTASAPAPAAPPPAPGAAANAGAPGYDTGGYDESAG